MFVYWFASILAILFEFILSSTLNLDWWKILKTENIKRIEAIIKIRAKVNI